MVREGKIARNIGIVLTNGVYFYTEKYKGDFFAAMSQNVNDAYTFDLLTLNSDNTLNSKIIEIQEKLSHGMIDINTGCLIKNVQPIDLKLKKLSLRYFFEDLS